MKLFMCFGGAAAVIDDDEAAEVAATAARHPRGQRHGRRRRSLSFRGKPFLPGNNHNKAGGKGNEKKPLDQQQKKRGMMDADDGDEGVYGVSRASSLASLAMLSSAASSASLDSSDTSPSSSSRSSTASSSPSVSGVLIYPPPITKRQASNKTPASSSPAAGAVAVVLCLLMVVLCGRVGATLLMSTALYLFPRRWPARTRKEKTGAVGSLECDAAASASEAEEEETAKRKVVTEGSLARNRNK